MISKKLRENVLNLKGLPENFDLKTIQFCGKYEIKKFETSVNLIFDSRFAAEFFRNSFKCKSATFPELRKVQVRTPINIDCNNDFYTKRLSRTLLTCRPQRKSD